MKVAIVHDYIKEYGGAERVLETLHELFPDAPVYTSLYLPEYLGPHKKRFTSWDIRTSWLQLIPFKAKLMSPLRLVAPFIFRSYNFSNYDVVIVSATGAYISNMIQKGSAKHICYCHTPPRYLYGYATAREWKKNLFFRIIGEVINHFLRMIDYKSAQNVDLFIANSEEVKKRIKKFYRKEAIIIYPPVDVIQIHTLDKEAVQNKKSNYFLAGGRLARAKGIDIIISAFIENKQDLKIFGRGFAGFGKKLQSKIVAPNIEFLGEITDEEKWEYMRNAKAFIFSAYDEDFGITPVEAMAAGTPVIAFKSGGVRETVIDKKTGIFYQENSASSLNDAIKKFESTPIRREDCYKQAQKFSKENFMREIQTIVSKTA